MTHMLMTVHYMHIENVSSSSIMLQMHNNVQEEVWMVQCCVQPDYGCIQANRHASYQCFQLLLMEQQLTVRPLHCLALLILCSFCLSIAGAPMLFRLLAVFCRGS